jgi:hypothetical protein
MEEILVDGSQFALQDLVQMADYVVGSGVVPHRGNHLEDAIIPTGNGIQF